LASAKREDRPVVLWASREVERLERAGAQRYHAGIALLECAIAMLAVGLTQRGEQARMAAVRLGQEHGYHEVTIRAERAAREALSAARPRVIDESTLEVARSIRSNDPERLPDHVKVAAPA
jgi:hypothetical protein